ncbi:MAG: hypothetical protein ACYTFA_07115 [Planctomycetota bacterium]|jgi:hypothetical protein
MSELNRAKLEELLSAYLDGEVDSREAKLVEGVLGKDESARRLLDELRQTANVVSSLPRHDAPKSIADDLWSRIERNELLGDLEATPASPRDRWSRLPGLLSMAAMLTLVVGGVLWIINSGQGPGAPQVDRVAMAPAEREEPAVPRGAVEKSAIRRKGSVERSTDEVPAKRKKGTAGRARRHGVARRSELPTHRAKGEANAVSKVPPQPRGRIPEQQERTNLLASADVEQKLAAGLDAGNLRHHRFANETVRLQLTMRDEARREALTGRMVNYLNKRRITDLSADKTKGRKRRRPTGGFFYRGQPGTNFDDTNQRQILVRVPRRELDGLFAQVAEDAEAAEEVALVSGATVVSGLGEARNVLRYGDDGGPHVVSKERARTPGGQMATDAADTTAISAEAGDEPETGVDRFLTDVMKAVDLDTDRKDEGEGDDPVMADETLGATAKTRGESAEGEAASQETRQSLVDRRSQALQEASRRRADEKKAAPSTGLTEDRRRGGGKGAKDRARWWSTDQSPASRRAGNGLSKPGAGSWGSERGFVTLVVELTVAGPERPSGPRPPEVTAPSYGSRPSHTSPGSNGTRKAKRTHGTQKRDRTPQE